MSKHNKDVATEYLLRDYNGSLNLFNELKKYNKKKSYNEQNGLERFLDFLDDYDDGIYNIDDGEYELAIRLYNSLSEDEFLDFLYSLNITENEISEIETIDDLQDVCWFSYTEILTHLYNYIGSYDADIIISDYLEEMRGNW